MDKKDKVLKKCKTNISYSKLNNRAMRKLNNKGKIQPKKLSPLRKSLNELDPRFDDLVRIMWRTPPLRMKDLKAQLKKERKEKKGKKSK